MSGVPIEKLLALATAAADETAPAEGPDRLRKHLIRVAAVHYGARGSDVALALGISQATVCNSRTYVLAYGRDRFDAVVDRIAARLKATRPYVPPLPDLIHGRPAGARGVMGVLPRPGAGLRSGSARVRSAAGPSTRGGPWACAAYSTGHGINARTGGGVCRMRKIGGVCDAYADLRRSREIRAIHAMTRELALPVDCYRGMVSRATCGRTTSSAEMRAEERQLLLDWLRKLGAGKGRGRSRAMSFVSPLARKAFALWMGLHSLGEVEDGGDKAFRAWVARQTDCANPDWLSPEQLADVIEALRAWASRAGWHETRTAGGPSGTIAAKRSLAIAIHRRIEPDGSLLAWIAEQPDGPWLARDSNLLIERLVRERRRREAEASHG